MIIKICIVINSDFNLWRSDTVSVEVASMTKIGLSFRITIACCLAPT